MLAAAGFANRYKTSDRSELALRLNAMLTSQKNSRGSSNQSSHTKKSHSFEWPFYWWALRGSNSRPSRCKRDALPAELSARPIYEMLYTLIKKNNQALFSYFLHKKTRHPISTPFFVINFYQWADNSAHIYISLQSLAKPYQLWTWPVCEPEFWSQRPCGGCGLLWQLS